MRTLYRIILGLVPAMPVFYLAYLGTNLVMEFVVVFSEIAKDYWETRDFKVFMDFSMDWSSAFVFRSEFQLIYIFIGLVVVYKYIEWYYTYVTKPSKVKREKERIKRGIDVGETTKEVKGINKGEEAKEVQYRAIESIRLEEDVESKELMREILEVVRGSKDVESEAREIEIEELKEKAKGLIPVKEEEDLQEDSKPVKGRQEPKDDDLLDDLGFQSMVSDKRAKEIAGEELEDDIGEDDLGFTVVGRRKP